MWHTVIVTATEWDNFFKLRTNEQAQYEIRRIADLMYEAYHAWVRLLFYNVKI
jgi:thymidylate synthase ThyX